MDILDILDLDEADILDLDEAVRILTLVAYQPDPCNRVYAGQDEAAKVVLDELKRLQKEILLNDSGLGKALRSGGMTRYERIKAMSITEVAEQIVSLNLTDEFCGSDCDGAGNFECDGAGNFECDGNKALQCCVRWLGEVD